MSGILQDVIRAARGATRDRSFSAVVTLTVALGIGATTSIFSVVYGILLAPLPYPDPDRIVVVNEQLEASGDNVLLAGVPQAAGSDLSSVLKTTVYLTDFSDFPSMNAVFAEHFGLHRPARTTVQVSALPAGVSVEIDAIAVVGDPGGVRSPSDAGG